MTTNFSEREAANYKIFSDLSREKVNFILSSAKEVFLKKGSVISFAELKNSDLLLIKKGKLDLQHGSIPNEQKYQESIKNFNNGDAVDLSDIDQSDFVLFVQADTVFLCFSKNNIINALSDTPSELISFLKNSKPENYYVDAQKLYIEKVQESLARVRLGTFLVYILTSFGIYGFLVELIVDVEKNAYVTTYVTALTLLIFAFFMFLMVKNINYPLSEFGLNTKNWLRASLEGIGISVIFCGLVTLLVWFAIQYIPVFSNLTFISSFSYMITTPKIWRAALVYILFVPFQVFLAHGALQSPLILFLRSHNAVWIAAFVSTLLFGMVHVDLDIAYGIAVLFPGFLWAILYSRYRSLVPLFFSHALIGIWCLWFLPLVSIFKIVSAHAHII